jgi:IPT/TIG domain-containing protein
MAATRPPFGHPPRLKPASGSPLGGDAVTITGQGLVAGTTVAFGATPATTVTIVSPGKIVAVTPPGAGEVTVTVSVPGAPAIELPFTYTNLAIEVVRPDDLLALRFEFVNLALDQAADPRLVRATPGQPAYVVVHLPPQHLAEAAFDEDPAGVLQALSNPPAAGVLAGESRLAFLVPDGTDAVPLNLAALLDWTHLMAAPPAAQPRRQPSLTETAIELPYRLVLSPAADPAWRVRSAAPQGGAPAEVWHVVLEAGGAGGHPSVQVVWSPDLDPKAPASPLPAGPLAIDAGGRAQIAQQAPVLPVDSLVLSSLGGSADLEATFPSAPDDGLAAWRQVVSQGRDEYVRLVHRGFLAPFGHRAASVLVSQRRPAVSPNGTPVEVLARTTIVVVTQPEVSYASASGGGGVRFPFRRVRITTATTPPVDPLGGGVTPITVSPGGVPFLWHLVAEDIDGGLVDFEMPLAFVPLSSAGGVEDAYGDLPREAGLRGQPVTLVPPAGAQGSAEDPQDGSANSPRLGIATMSFAVDDREPPSGADAPFVPRMDRATVSIPAVAHLLGSAGADAGQTIAYDDNYVANGFDPGANVGQVFARVVDQARPISLPPDRSGGLVAPQIPVDGLSRSLGPVAGAAGLANGGFDLAQAFNDVDVTLLGGIKLQDIVKALLPDDPFDATRVPALRHAELPDRTETSFRWDPHLEVQPGSDVSKFLEISDATKLSVTVTASTPLAPAGAPAAAEGTFVVDGSFSGFTLSFLGQVELAVDSLAFRAERGKKPDLTTGDGLDVRFKGELAFVQRLAEALPADGFSDPPFIDATADGVTAGFTLGLPALGIGVFSLENIGVSAALSVPFADAVGLRLAFSERYHPFLVTVSFIGGGGFFAIDVAAPDRIRSIEGSLELGGNLTLSLAVATANVHALAGFYFALTDTGATFAAYLRVGGSVELLGVVSISIELFLQLQYTTDKSVITGTASLTVGVHVLFTDTSVTLSVHKEFQLSEGVAPHALATTAVPVSFDEVMTPADWERYCRAFAGEPR